MKRIITVIFILAVFTAISAGAQDFLQVDKSKYTKLPGFLGYKADEFIVVLKSSVSVDHAKDMASPVALNNLPGFEDLAARFNVVRLRPQFIGSDRGPRAATPEAQSLARHYKVRISEGTLDEAVAAYSRLPEVERVEKIGIHTVYATPNDTYYDDPPPEFPYDQWHYWDTYGIRANTAWDTETGDQTVLVGDLDIGTMYDHGDLGGSNPPGPNDASTNGNIWVNTNEVPGNGVDDDGNGYVDDIIGWDFVDRTNWYSYPCIDIDCGGADNDPSDGEGHGTHTAGTIAAITNNGYAVAGVAGGFGNGTYSGGGNGIKVVPCRIGYVLDYWIYGPTGVVIMDYVAEAMYYMAELKIAGWNVASINCSFGSSNSGGLGAAADFLIAQDVVICVAAGNSSSSSPDYLGSRGDCLDVAATDENGNNASFTNYGSWVDIAAPGVSVLSTITDPADPGVDYIAAMDGTSMACPHAAGVVALLESYNPSLSAADKVAIITDPANTNPYGGNRDLGAGIIDARKCLDAAGGGCDLAADFSGNPTSGCVPLTVDFTDLSTGTGIDGWSWTFGDGGGSAAQNPSYTYNTAGTYSVTLTVSSSSQGCDDTQTKSAYITVNPLPVADFSGSPTSGTEPLTVNFTNLSANSTAWDWSFGDGGTSTSQNPSHTYSAGTYTVTLTASNACGSDVATKIDYITVAPCVAPTADFSGAPTSGDAPLAVDFTDLSTGNPTSWNWDFGDGTGTSTQQNPSYTYDDPGTYTVTLTAANACGSDAAAKTDYITVTCTSPVADFSGSPTTGCAPLAVDFTDLSTNASSWNWDFGDGAGTSTAQNPSYTYDNAGCYTVTLTVSNACGSDAATRVDYICVEECGPARAYANADLPVTGTVSGDFTYTFSSDDVYEAITEVEYTNHPRKRSSYLEHKWTIDVGGGGSSMMFYVEGYRPANADGDDFIFAYSTDDAIYTDMTAITGTADQVYSYALPDGLTGIVYVRVVDDDLTWGNTSLDPVYVDEMYIEFSSQPGPPAANFAGSPTAGDEPLTVDFTDLSTGSPTSWSWDFGDGIGTSAEQNPNYTYNNAGTYTVELTATNEYGSSTETKVDYITVTVPGEDYSHVESMVVGRAKVGPNYIGTCTVTIFDDNSLPLSDAAVYVTYDGPTGGSLNAVTGADGTVYFETAGMKKPSGEWCFEVTDVTHATHTYDPGSNNVTRACESGPVYRLNNAVVPISFALVNYPNPFNPTTTFEMALPQASDWTISIYNITGRKVEEFRGSSPAGIITVDWDASGYASGIYFYRATAGEYSATRKMILMK